MMPICPVLGLVSRICPDLPISAAICQKLAQILSVQKIYCILIWRIFKILIFYADKVMVVGEFQKFACI